MSENTMETELCQHAHDSLALVKVLAVAIDQKIDHEFAYRCCKLLEQRMSEMCLLV